MVQIHKIHMQIHTLRFVGGFRGSEIYPAFPGKDSDMEKEKKEKKEKKDMGLVRKVLITAAAVAAAGYAGASAFFAKTIARPDGMSLEKERDWEEAHGLWGKYDLYEKEAYTVEGYQGYVLHCQLVKAEEASDKYVILSHGFRSNRNGSVKYVDAYHDLGYHCIIYDVRAHGENEKTVCTLGALESEDLYNLIEDTYERYGKDIHLGLHGESMGSSISLSVLAKKPKVEFVVADCGFANLYDLIRTGYRQMHFEPLICGVEAVVRLLYGYDMKDTDPIGALRENTVPICFIHGKVDTFILPENSEKLSKATGGAYQLHLIDGAGHAQSREILGKEGYQKLLEAFLAS